VLQLINTDYINYYKYSLLTSYHALPPYCTQGPW